MIGDHQGNRDTGTPMFVHDFVSVPVPVSGAISGFTSLAPVDLAGMVATIWNSEAEILRATCRAGLEQITTHGARLDVYGHRARTDAAVISIRWAGDGWLPSLDADLELVGFGDTVTHLHLMGRYELPDAVERYSETGSLVQRVMVVVIRNFLSDLGSAICASASCHPRP